MGAAKRARQCDGGCVELGVVGNEHFGDGQDAANARGLSQQRGSEVVDGSHQVVVHEQARGTPVWHGASTGNDGALPRAPCT